jgi:23S rRNA pseudouridine1911/1915/1917 synthase
MLRVRVRFLSATCVRRRVSFHTTIKKLHEPPRVLFEDNHLLVVNKPPGLLAQGDITGDATLLDQLRHYLAAQRKKDINTVYLGLVHRIDRVTSGVMVYAKTSKAASRLSEDFRHRRVFKHYLAVVNVMDNTVEVPESGECEQWLASATSKNTSKPQINNRTVISNETHDSSKRAHLRYKRINVHIDMKDTKKPPQLLLHVQPTSGRKHQIRVQLSHIGLPIVGDMKYGAPQRFKIERDIALHALCLTVRHPTQWDKWLTFHADVPETWLHRFGSDVVEASNTLAETIKMQGSLLPVMKNESKKK